MRVVTVHPQGGFHEGGGVASLGGLGPAGGIERQQMVWYWRSMEERSLA